MRAIRSPRLIWRERQRMDILSKLDKFAINVPKDRLLTKVDRYLTCTISYTPQNSFPNLLKTSCSYRCTFCGSHSFGGNCTAETSNPSKRLEGCKRMDNSIGTRLFLLLSTAKREHFGMRKRLRCASTDIRNTEARVLGRDGGMKEVANELDMEPVVVIETASRRLYFGVPVGEQGRMNYRAMER